MITPDKQRKPALRPSATRIGLSRFSLLLAAGPLLIYPPLSSGRTDSRSRASRLALTQQPWCRRGRVVVTSVDAEVAEPEALRQPVEPCLLRHLVAGVVLRRARRQ